MNLRTAVPKEADGMPRLLVAGIVLCILGFAFPIYGIPLGTIFKLTLWRAGLLVLLPAFLFLGVRFKDRRALQILAVFLGLAVMRSVSLLMTKDRAPGSQQLEWFVEGVLFLLLMTTLSSRYSGLPIRFLRIVFFVGLVSVGVMALQFIMISFGKLLTLPLLTTAFGFPADSRPWTYPLSGGGRIIGAFMDPNMSGSMCAFYIATFLPFLLMRGSSRVVHPLMLAAGLVLALVGMVGTGSRQALVAAGGAFLAVLAMLAARNPRLAKAALQRVAIFAVLLIVLLTTGLFSHLITTPAGEVQQSVFVRFAAGGDITGGRLPWIREIVSSMNLGTVLFGMGEGQGILTAHNAYLIVLNENGIVALFLLVALSALLPLSTARRALSQTDTFGFCMGVAGFAVSLVWIAVIFINWAQLNQSVSYMYLALPVIFLNVSSASKARTGRAFQRASSAEVTVL